MARADQFRNNGGADKACRSGDEYPHRSILLLWVRSPDPKDRRLENTIYAVKSVLSSRSSEATHGSPFRRAVAAKAAQLHVRRLRYRRRLVDLFRPARRHQMLRRGF